MGARKYAMRMFNNQEDVNIDDLYIDDSSRAHRVANLRTMLGRLIDAENEVEKTRTQLELERQQLRAIFDCIEEPITVVDLYDKHILFYNDAFETMAGPVDEGVTCHSLIYGSDDVCDKCPFASEPVDKTNAYSFENYSEPLNRWFYCLHKFILWPNTGMHDAVFSLAIDITSRKKTEEALRASQLQFSKAFFSSPIAGGISSVTEGRFIDVNKAFEALTGYTRAEVIGKTVYELELYNDQTDRDKILSLIEKDGNLSGYNLWIRKKDGELCFGSMHMELVEGFAEEMQILSVVVDDTDKNYLEEMYRSVIECSLQGLAVFTDDSLIYVNDLWREIINATEEDIATKKLDSWVSNIYSADRNNAISRLKAIFEGKDVPEHAEYRYILPDGSMIWLRVRSRGIKHRGISAIQCAIQDITKEKQMEEELYKLRKIVRESKGYEPT